MSAQGASPPAAGRPGSAGRLRERFRRHRGARLALRFLLGLLLAAVLAPLLANEFPLFAVIDGHPTLPALRAFTATDVIWTAGGLWLLAVALLHRFRLRRRLPNLWRWLALGGGAAVFALAAAVEPTNLAVVDYRALGRQEGNWCLWAPVPHGWRDQEERRAGRLAPPLRFGDHPLGTDGHGRDVLARLVHGARTSLVVGLGAVGLALIIGCLVGAFAGYLGGRTDAFLSWLIQVVMCFPVLFAVLVLQVFLPPGLLWVVLLLALIRWTGAARLMRAEVRRLRAEDFVSAARVQGVSAPGIILRHLVPNALAPVLVNAAFGVAAAILLESALSFLGLGVPPPQPSWGEMLAQGREAMNLAPQLVILPGLAIFLSVLSINLVGEGLRDALDPRSELGGDQETPGAEVAAAGGEVGA